MPYKIVQTIEKGRPVLTAVPDNWEKDGILYWPKKHEKLRRVEHSLPDANWRTIDCILKRSHLSSFTQAVLEIDNMSNFSDTETDNENNQINRNYIKNSATSNKIKITQNYNEMADKCCMFQVCQPQHFKETLIPQGSESQYSQVSRAQNNILINSPTPSVIIHSDISIPAQKFTETENNNDESSISLQNFEVITEKHTEIGHIKPAPQVFMTENKMVPPSVQNATISNVIGVDEVQAIILQKLDQVQEDLRTLVGEFKIITENQHTFFQNQNNMLLKLAENQTQLEEFVKQSCTSKEHDNMPDVKPISNKKELQELELSLTDPNFKGRFKNKIEVVCSKGKDRGINNAYALIDVLFQRSFLCQCSWAGGSRTGEAKICLKSFTNIFDLFFSVLHESDSGFKKPDCEKFIKTILKNSRQRCVSQKLRMSTMRHRQKEKKITSTSPSKVSICDELLGQPKANCEMIRKQTTTTLCEGSNSMKLPYEPLAGQSEEGYQLC